MEVLIITLIVLIIGTLAILGYQQVKRRREELFVLATKLGLQYESDPGDVHDAYSAFIPFGKGSARRSSNLLSGRLGQIDWEIFDYAYTTGSGDDRKTHSCSIIAAHLPLGFPGMTIRPEGLFDKIASLAGFDDINFESEEFSCRYHVKCDDRKFAYDLIHPKMIELLLSVEPRHWQIRGTRLLLTRQRHHKVSEIEPSIQLIESFLAQVPDYVRQDRTLPLPPQAGVGP
jgi:hypothetical protein